MYGSGQNPNSLLSQLEKTAAGGGKSFNMSGGEQARDYLPVEKVAEYMVSIALQTNIEGVINCCSGIPVTVKEFARAYLRSVDGNIELNLGYYPYTDYEPMHFWGSVEKLNKALEKN